MTELEAQAKDFAISHKMNLLEPTVIAHTIELMEEAYIAGADYIKNKRLEEDDSDSLLVKLKQKNLIKTWNYEGSHYHYEIEIISDIEPDEIPWN